MTKMIRQGDVLLIRRDDIRRDDIRWQVGQPTPSENGRLILARGEATGHHHSVADTDAELIRVGEQMLLAVHRQTALEHQEHTSHTLEPGVHEVIRQREYTGRGTDWRPVRD